MARMYPMTRRGTGDGGASLVMALAVVLIVFTLGGGWLAWADHQTDASRHDRDRQRAIDAANAGLAAAQVTMAVDGGASVLGTTQSGSLSGATYEYVITAGAGSERLVRSWGYAPSPSSPQRVVRSMQQSVELKASNGSSFQFAIQSGQTVPLEVNAYIKGDVYATGDLNAKGAVVDGNVYATGSVNDSPSVNGNVYAGANASVATVNGNVYAGLSVWIKNGGNQVNGSVQAKGAIDTCGSVTGTCQAFALSVPPVPPVPLPTFAWTPADYPAGTQTWTGDDVFRAWAVAQTAGISGAHRVQGEMNFASNDELVVAGDVTIYQASGNTTLPKRIKNVAGREVSVRFITEGTINRSDAGSFTSDATIKLLLFSSQNTNLTNKCVFSGTVVSPETINGGTNCAITFAPVDATGLTFPPGSPQTPQSYIVRSVALREVAP
jgi:Tfp pilus assembly protein PilX